ncbi:hypothetical protein GCM10027592_22300 [Spirosoma flavus]
MRELTTQSWNLELVISGAALFAVLQLPDLLDVVFDYFRYNLMSHTAGLQGSLPLLAYSMMKATCYVLFLAFLTNFVMRAFWVGLVGLLAVYPTGIHYDRIPFSTKYAQERMAADMGSLEAYILRLDRRCNVVFAVAFLFVFFLIILASAYLALMLIYSVLRPIIPVQYWPAVKIAAYVLFAIYMLASFVLSLPKVRAHPVGIDLHYRFTTLFRIFLWGLYKPSGFILNTFYSHLSYQRILRTMGLMFGAFIVIVALELLSGLPRMDSRTAGLNRRHLNTDRVDRHSINAGMYDDQRAEDDYIDMASIQADVIREPFIRLYVAYPKALDTLLAKLAPKPDWSDTLSRTEKRQQTADWSSKQINRIIRLSVNDSLYQKPDLLFTQRGPHQQRGWQTILLPTNLKLGKNMIKVSIQAGASKEEEIAEIPFWYVPEN